MSYSSEVLADSPVLYWRLGESSGATAQDASPNNNDGTYNGTPTYGQPGLADDGDTAVALNEGDTGATVGTDYISSPSINLTAGTGFTIEALIKPGTNLSTSQHPKIAYGPHGAFQDVNNLQLSSLPAPWQLQYRFDGSQILSSTTDFDVETEYCICVTWVSSSGLAKLYVNGTEEDSMTVTGFSPGNGVWVVAATDDTVTTTRYRGIVDEFALYDHALSGARVTAHCQARASLECELTAEDEVLFVDATYGNVTVSLFPDDALAFGPIRYIKRIDGTTNTVTIDPGATTINRQDSMILMPQDAIALVCDSQEWWTL